MNQYTDKIGTMLFMCQAGKPYRHTWYKGLASCLFGDDTRSVDPIRRWVYKFAHPMERCDNPATHIFINTYVCEKCAKSFQLVQPQLLRELSDKVLADLRQNEKDRILQWLIDYYHRPTWKKMLGITPSD